MAAGANIRRLRLDKGWTLADLSERSGVEVGTISALEMKNSSRSKYLGQLADALGVSQDELEGRPPSPSGVADPIIADLAALPEREAQLIRAEIAAKAAQARLDALRTELAPALPKSKQSA